MTQELIDIAEQLADYLHATDQSFGDVVDQLERQTNGHLEIMNDDVALQSTWPSDTNMRPEDWSVFDGDNMQDDRDVVVLPVTPIAPHGGCNWSGCTTCFPKDHGTQ